MADCIRIRELIDISDVVRVSMQFDVETDVGVDEVRCGVSRDEPAAFAEGYEPRATSAVSTP